MGTTGSARGGARERFVVTEAERHVADLMPIEVAPALARATVEMVPFWSHTFALNRAEGIYTPGAARDHRYRVSALPEDFAGMSVLDVGCFDGFYAFLAERRGAERVVAVDNEQYRLWVASRWGVELEAGRASEPFIDCSARASSIDGWTRSRSTSWRSASTSSTASASLHRVENPLGLLRVLRGRTVSGGTVLLETYGVGPKDRTGPAIRVSEPGEGLPARRVRLLGIRGRRPAAACPDCRLLPRRVARRCGGRRPPADHRSAGRLEAPGRRSQQPLHETSISGGYRRSGLVELSGSTSAPIRTRSDWRFGATRLPGC
jgi:SAM-dependent methyltransferase